jgi:hypothetical protein
MPGVGRPVLPSGWTTLMDVETRSLQRLFHLRTAGWIAVSALLTTVSVQAQTSYTVRPSADPCLNLREAPESEADLIDCIAPGTTLVVLDSVPYWRHVRLGDGREGWVAKKFIEPTPVPPITPPPDPIPSDAFLEVHFIDVGHGDAIWIHTFDDGIDGNGIFEGRNIIIDGGPNASDQTNRKFAYLEDQGHHGAEIDALIVTHPHDDHYPGADGLRRHFDVLRYYDLGIPKGGEYQAFLTAMQTGTPHAAETFIGRDTFGTLDYWGNEVDAQIIYAWPGAAQDGDLGEGTTLENNASIVL